MKNTPTNHHLTGYRHVLLSLLLLFAVFTENIAQKRCYTYDAAGCRVLRDQSCDEDCSLVVTNTNDAGVGSLRKAINCAENGDTITFAPTVIGQTIVLTSGPIEINKTIHILQTISSEVTVQDGAPTFQVNSATLELQHIIINAECKINFLGTGLHNYGEMILRDVTIVEDGSAGCGNASVYNLGGMIIEGFTKIIQQ